jgi:hypothetical protein
MPILEQWKERRVTSNHFDHSGQTGKRPIDERGKQIRYQ